MTPDRPVRPSSDAERVRVSTRGSRVQLALSSFGVTVILTGILVGKPPSLDGFGNTSVVATILIVLLLVIVATARFLRFTLPVVYGLLPGLKQAGRVLAVDATGIWYIQKRQRILLPWQDIAGVGYTEDPDNKFNFIIEIYPRDASRYGDEELLRQWMNGGISHHGMPTERLAFPPMRLDPIRDKLSPAVRAYSRRSWVGGRPHASSQRVLGS